MAGHHNTAELSGQSSQVSASRSFNMSRIKSGNTRAEMLLRRAMWKAHIRYRIHVNSFPGKPDIIIQKYRLAIFVDGAFWHGHHWEQNRFRIKTNTDFWVAKIEGNMRRDQQVNLKLEAMGFAVMRFWDHQVLKELPKCLNQIKLYLESSRLVKIPERP